MSNWLQAFVFLAAIIAYVLLSMQEKEEQRLLTMRVFNQQMDEMRRNLSVQINSDAATVGSGLKHNSKSADADGDLRTREGSPGETGYGSEGYTTDVQEAVEP